MAAAPQDRPNLMIGCRLVGWIGSLRIGRHPFGVIRLLGAYSVVRFPAEGALTHYHALRHFSAFLPLLPTFKEAKSQKPSNNPIFRSPDLNPTQLAPSQSLHDWP